MTQKIRFARPGDRLSAAYVNKIVDAANLAIDVLGPARSKRLTERDSFNPQLDENGNGTIEGLGTRIYTEVSRITSTVRVTDPSDETVYVDVDRIDQVEMASTDDRITLVFDND